MRRFWGFLFLCLLLIPSARGTEMLTVTPKGHVFGWKENTFLVYAPEAGTVTCAVSDEYNTYVTFSASVTPGVNAVHWDGQGENGERMNEKSYRMTVSMDGMTAACRFELEQWSQALMMALASSDTVYTIESEWFLEYKLYRNGELVVELAPADAPETALYAFRKESNGGNPLLLTWKEFAGNHLFEDGEYLLTMYAPENREYRFTIPISVRNEKAPVKPVTVTGSIMPSAEDSDEEIWKKMTADAVVLDLDYTAHQPVYAEADTGSDVLGTFHGQTQSLSVFSLEGDWAYVGSWNHETGDYIEGWVPRAKLKTVTPRKDYGLLLDKRAQTLTLFDHGKRAGTILVCTGAVDPGAMFQETAAGSFLTGLHMSDFSENGLRYDHVIRFDGGNLLHQIPYAWGDGKKDFRDARALLGTKASHGCVRVQAEAGENGLNMYWLWTHLSFRTRVILLDDPMERAEAARWASGERLTYAESVVTETDEPEEGETEVILTLGGDAVLGTRENWQNSVDAFPAYIRHNGYGWPFRNLKALFSADDLTLVNLEGVLKDNGDHEDTSKQYRFRGTKDYTAILKEAGVELVNIANNHTIDYGAAGTRETENALTEAGIRFCGNENNFVTELKGHLFGFGGCRETNYLADPGIVKRDIAEMKAAGCEVIVYCCHFGTEYAANHTRLQEAMARACVRAGADLVVGTHAHVVQGVEQIGNSAVLYGLGNLVFGGTIRLSTFDALVAQASFRFSGETYLGVELTLFPVLTSGEAETGVNNNQPVLAMGEDRLRILQKVQDDTRFPLREVMWFPVYRGLY